MRQGANNHQEEENEEKGCVISKKAMYNTKERKGGRCKRKKLKEKMKIDGRGRGEKRRTKIWVMINISEGHKRMHVPLKFSISCTYSEI